MRLEDFEGRWYLNRSITHAHAPNGHFNGVAEWRPDDTGLYYRETGKLVIAGHPPMQTERSYSWRAGLMVFFEDGRFFHKVPTSGTEAVYICEPDEYRVVYRFEAWPIFETEWRVRGPRKDYIMVTRYTPSPSEP